MIGQRQRPRDPDLPALLGDEDLCALPVERMAGLIGAALLRDGAPNLKSVEWSYARWKPGISTTTAYEVCFEDGEREVVVAKRYADGKDRLLGQRPLKERHWDELSPRLVPRSIIPEASCVLFTHVADREVQGSSWMLDPRNLAHLVRDSGLAAAGEVRKRRLRTELLRYKPERRAVYRADVRLRDENRRRFSLGCRILPRADAREVFERREAFGAGGAGLPVPALRGFDARRGILVEEWLDVVASEGNDFSHTRTAGNLAARFHRPVRGDRACSDVLELADLTVLFRVLGDRTLAPVRVQLPGEASRVWCHGDLHPDQLARTQGGIWYLLDLDCLAPSDPAIDLASWIADACTEGPADETDLIATELLAGYSAAGGTVPDRRRLWAHVAGALVRRAAATIRRLEAGAPKRAEELLSIASEVAPRGVLRTTQRTKAESKR